MAHRLRTSASCDLMAPEQYAHRQLHDYDRRKDELSRIQLRILNDGKESGIKRYFLQPQVKRQINHF